MFAFFEHHLSCNFLLDNGMFLWIENSFFNHLMHLPIFTDTNINNGISVEIFSDRNIPTCRTKKKYTGISCYSIDQASQEPCHAILYY